MQMDLNWKNVHSLELGSPAGNLTQKMYRATASYFSPGICKWVAPHGRTLGCHEWKLEAKDPQDYGIQYSACFFLKTEGVAV